MVKKLVVNALMDISALGVSHVDQVIMEDQNFKVIVYSCFISFVSMLLLH